ncbi:PAS-domain containing protein [Pararhodobacter zhoushanensis]|uniref:PAS-domain containing protein n=1 Tax=Pararhodobacter zhoushanensis TaxID=2479545 RepID=A0ABT3GUP4_9RHOB|nr:PAS-domain containing protein [Pararhodobacter zhoushanensis]MCW1931224.1 PAS-domain containing protein [Pararhodobacter zhoushanensis]
MPTTLGFALVLVGTSALTVVAILLIVSAVLPSRSRSGSGVGTGSDAAFLFDGTSLVDANARGHALLESLRQSDGHSIDDWERLTRFLSADIPDLPAAIDTAPRQHQTRLTGIKGCATEVVLDWLDGALRLTVIDALSDEGAILLDRLSFRALQDELNLLRQMTESAPLLLWREDAQGQVTWANGAYLKYLTDSGKGVAIAWPLPALFPAVTVGPGQRISLPNPDDDGQSWFDLTRVNGGESTLAYALPADNAHQAERTKSNFIQTLTKTFATLPIGLAVFDRARRLQMFNPALTDLTGLEPEFLLSRPGIEGFLNRMRDKHVLPEPRDYRSWARRLLEIETSAPVGEFEETWSLPSGQTFRVSASPHPDGALAFLIEDITSETHHNRHVRAEMETSQSVLNQLDEAIAVFSATGQLMLTNTAFSQLWMLEGEESLNAVTLPEALDNWREAGDDPALWSRVAALSRPGQHDGQPVSGLMRMADGEQLRIEARRTSTGALMISFAQIETPVSTTTRAQVLHASV